MIFGGVILERKCTRCYFDLTTSYLLKAESFRQIVCPNCGRILVATDISRFLAITIFIMGSLICTMLPIKILNIFIIESIWFTISYFFLPAFIYNYEEKDKDDMG
jgi:hypothetical protein